MNKNERFLSLKNLGLGKEVLLWLGLLAAWFALQPPSVLNAHSYRQAHTAVVARMFLWNHFDWLHPTILSSGKPGVNPLEFPLYQLVVAGLTFLSSGVGVAFWGRAVNFLSLVVFVFAVVALTRDFWGPKEGDAGIPAEFPYWWRPLLATSPVLFGVSLWVLADLMELALLTLGLWSLLRGMALKRPLLSLLGSLTLSLGLAIKPGPLFVVFFLGLGAVWRFHSKKQDSIKGGGLFALWMLLAVVIPVFWFGYAKWYQSQHPQTFELNHNYFVLSSYDWQRVPYILGRFFVYALGGLCVLIPLIPRGRAAFSSVFPVGALIVSAVSYILFSLALLARHSYYQLPLLLPAFVMLGHPLVLKGLQVQIFERRPWWPAVLAAAAFLNLGIVQQRFVLPDPHLEEAIAVVKSMVPRGPDLPELSLVADDDLTQMQLSFELDRFLALGGLWKDPTRRGASDFLAFCGPEALGRDCRAGAGKLEGRCLKSDGEAKVKETSGGYWMCYVANQPL